MTTGQTHILYSFRRCPYAMRGRMALIAAGISYEHRELILRDKPASMLAYSPKGTVPVFVTKNGQVIDESLDLMRWALTQNDPQDWLGGDASKTADLIAQNDGDFKHHLDRYKYASRYKDDAARGDVDLSHRASAQIFISTLETALTANANLARDTPSLADIAIFPFIRQFANTDREWWDSAPYPKTQSWLERHLGSELFKTCMTKHKLWADPQDS